MDLKRNLKVTIELFVDAPDDRVLSTQINDALREVVTMGHDQLPYGKIVAMSNGVSIRSTPENKYRKNGVSLLVR